MGYYEVKYKTGSGSTKTTSGKNLSSVKSRLKDKGYTVVSSKYVSTSSKSSSSSRASLSMAEEKGMSNVTSYSEDKPSDKKKSSSSKNQGDTSNENVIVPPQVGREYGTVTDVAEQAGLGYGTSLPSKENEYKVVPEKVASSISSDRTGMTATPKELGTSVEGAVDKATTGTGKNLSDEGVSYQEIKTVQKSASSKWTGDNAKVIEAEKPGTKMSISDFQAKIEKSVYNLEKTGQELIDFDPNKTVTIEGKKYAGKDIIYTVEDFQPEFLYTSKNILSIPNLIKEKGSTKTLTAGQYDIYLENLGKKYKKEAEKLESDMKPLITSSGDWHPDTTVREIKTDKGFKYEVDFPFVGADSFYSTKRNIQKEGFTGLLATAFTPSDPLGLKSAYYVATGQKSKVWDTKVSAVADTRRPFHEFYLSSPMGVIGTTAIAAPAIGAGIGAVSAVSATGGKLLSVGVGSYFTYKAGEQIVPQIQEAIASGDYGSLVGTSTNLGLAVATALPTAKWGYHSGYGRTEAFLYGRSTYTPGSAEYIRYKNTLKTARRLQNISSKDIKPLDFTKDIMRLDPETAGNVLKYLEQNPKSIVGGSASQYAQTSKSIWSKYRDVKPRDVDLLVKDIAKAKSATGGIKHKVDVHETTFGTTKEGYMRFGFKSQKPVSIEGIRYQRLGEQLVRKGTSSVTTETQYRWFKDVPDFRMASEQLISSGKTSVNPLNRVRAYMGAKSYKYVVDPVSSPSYGKPVSSGSKILASIAKKSSSVRLSSSDITPSSSVSSYVSSVSSIPKVSTVPSISSIPIRPSVSKSVVSKVSTPSVSKVSSSVFKPPSASELAASGMPGPSVSKSVVSKVSTPSVSKVSSSVSKLLKPSTTTSTVSKTYSPTFSVPKISKTIKPKTSKAPKYMSIKKAIPKHIIYKPSKPPQYKTPKYIPISLPSSFSLSKKQKKLFFEEETKKKKSYQKKPFFNIGYRFRKFDVPDLDKIGRRMKL